MQEENDLSKADELIEETSDKEKVVLDKEPFWAEWCPICRESAPFFMDPVGYICNKCEKTVCAKCIYPYEGKLICQNCAKKLPPEEQEKLHPLFNQRLHLKSKSRVNFLRLELVDWLLTAGIGFLLMLIGQFKFASLVIIIGSALGIALIIYFMVSYEKEAEKLYIQKNEDSQSKLD